MTQSRIGLFLLAGLLTLAAVPGAVAAALAEEHTVLYYLVEMQRRATRTCNGAPMPEAPSLMPSERLRAIARESATSGTPWELEGIAHLATSAHGGTARQAFDDLIATQCSALMGAEYHYIGASHASGRWTVILAAAEPGPSASDPASGSAPGFATDSATGLASGLASGLTPDSAPAPAPDMTPEKAYVETPDAPEQAGPPPATPGLAGPADVPPLPADLDKPWPKDRLNEAAPARPIVVGEMELDVAGRPLAPVRNPGFADTAATVPPAAPPTTRPKPVSGAGVTPLEDTRPARATESGSAVVPVPHPAASPTLSSAPPPLPSGPTPARTAPVSVAPAAPRVEKAEHPSEMLGLINAARAQGGACGASPMPSAPALRSNAMLVAAAEAHARDMAAGRYLSSTRADGTTLGGRVADSGYIWESVTENLSSGRATADQALRRWLDNEDQCHNLMAVDYKDIGIGFEPTGRYWSVIVATPLAEGGSVR